MLISTLIVFVLPSFLSALSLRRALESNSTNVEPLTTPQCFTPGPPLAEFNCRTAYTTFLKKHTSKHSYHFSRKSSLDHRHIILPSFTTVGECTFKIDFSSGDHATAYMSDIKKTAGFVWQVCVKYIARSRGGQQGFRNLVVKMYQASSETQLTDGTTGGKVGPSLEEVAANETVSILSADPVLVER